MSNMAAPESPPKLRARRPRGESNAEPLRQAVKKRLLTSGTSGAPPSYPASAAAQGDVSWSEPESEDGEGLVFEDDSGCEEFIPKGAVCGAAAAALALVPAASNCNSSPRLLPVAIQALLPSDSLSAHQELTAVSLLTPEQTAAVRHVAVNAMPRSRAAETGLECRLRRWGHEPGKLKELLRYIRDEAPIIVHIDLPARLDRLQKDTHYRNQFETGCTSGSSDLEKREAWEERLFCGAYRGVAGPDRVKYGVLNATNDPCGVATVAKQYGKDYFVLRGVRLRTTFSDKDSCNQGELASCEWYAHVLEKYSDLELRAVADVALGGRLSADSAVLDTAAGGYKEVQIHGHVRLDSHVEAVAVHPSRRGTQWEERIAAWCRSLGLRFEFMPAAATLSEPPPLAKARVRPRMRARMEPAGAATPLWRWGPRNPGGPWLRFDTFASEALERRFRGDPSAPLPALPVGRAIAVDLTSMVLDAEAGGNGVQLALWRCGAPSSGGSVPLSRIASARPVSLPVLRTLWEWCAAACGRDHWTPYAPGAGELLEAAYRRGSQEASLTVAGSIYRVDFRRMVQINWATGYERLVRRVEDLG